MSEEAERMLNDAIGKFRGQKVMSQTQGTFKDARNVPEGTYVAEVVMADKRERKGRLIHFLMLRIVDGEESGVPLFPFANRLDEIDGVQSAADNFRRILGDEGVPGHSLRNGEFEYDLADVLTQLDELNDALRGEHIEVNVRNQKALKDDGTPWQAVYINRGLGEDRIPKNTRRPTSRHEVIDEDDALPGLEAPKSGRKLVKKKKVVKKKATLRSLS